MEKRIRRIEWKRPTDDAFTDITDRLSGAVVSATPHPDESLARTVGPVVMGGLYTLLGYRAPFLLGAVLLLPVLFIASRIEEPREPVGPRPVDPGQAR